MTLTLTVLNNQTSVDMGPINQEMSDKFIQMFAKYTWSQLNRFTGGLSEPSKMPCHSYGISAKRCKVGSALQKVPGSTCSKCYALKGMYVFPNVKAAMERRYEAMQSSTNIWIAAMVASIRKATAKATGLKYFRWHDSGDLQGYNHLMAILYVVKNTPEVHHWLPTREYGLLRRFIVEGNVLPNNIVVRVSLPMIGSADGIRDWDNVSTVALPKLPDNVKMDLSRVDCPAYTQDNECGSCRSCWDRSIKVINYPLH